ncbi:MAG: GAF domain-containing protein [Chloroflexi bacterium]|nr:GAF domain-containing protein [Chloroflexota bacterium]
MQDQKIQPHPSSGPFRWFVNRPFRVQLFIIVAVFVALAFVLLIAVTTQINRVIHNNVNDDLTEHADENSEQLVVPFEIVPADFDNITSNYVTPSIIEVINRRNTVGEVDNLARQSVINKFDELLIGRPLYHSIRLIGIQGRELVAVERSNRTGNVEVVPNADLKNRENEDYFQAGLQLRRTGQVWTSKVVLARDASGRPIEPFQQIMTLVTPVLDESNNLAALLVVDIDIDWLVRSITTRKSGDEIIYVLDQDGYYLAVSNLSDEQDLLYGRSTSFGEQVSGTLAGSLLTTQSTDNIDYRKGDTDYLAATSVARPLVNLPDTANQPVWTVVVSMEMSEIAGPTRFILGAFAVVFLGLLIIASVLLGYVATQISRRFEAIGAGLVRVNRGDLTTRLPTSEMNEFGRVATLFNNVTERTQTLIDDLQARVQARIRDLDLTAEISREIAGLRDQNLVLNRTINRIIEQFDYYHAQVFLIDDRGEHAALVASTGEAGQRLLTKKHKLAVGSNSVIGRVTALGVTVIAGDTTSTEVPWQPNVELPNTRSEMALPLKVEDRVIGALDIQSIRPEAYSPEDIEIFQVLADQLAIAINNARLIEQLEQRVDEVATLNRRLTEKAWEEYARSQPDEVQLGYQYNLIGIKPVPPDESKPANGNLQSVTLDDKSAYSVQISVGGKAVGQIETKAPERAQLSKDEQALVDAVANRVALAVDNARLFQQTQMALGESQRLYEMARTVSSAAELNIEAVYALINEQLGYYENLDGLAILLADPFPSHLAPNVVVAHLWMRMGSVSSWEVGQRLPLLQQGLSAHFEIAPRSPMSVHASELSEKPEDSNQVLPYLMRTFDAETLYLMPLVTGAKWFGVLVCSSQAPNAFTESYMSFTSAVGDQLAIAVENRRLLEEVQKEARRALALADAGQLASRISTDFEDDVNRLFRAVSEPGDFDRWWFGVLDFDGQSLRQVAAFSPQESNEAPYMAQRLNLKRDRNAITESVLIRQVVLVNERVHPTFGKLSAQEHIVYGKHLALPVMTSNEVVIGALLIGRRASQPDLDERDIQLATTLASQLAIATENQRLFAAVENQRQTLQSTLEAMPAGVLLLTPRGNSLLSNQRAIDLLGGGVNKALFSSNTFPIYKIGTSDLYPPEEFPTTIALRENAIVSAENISVEYPDGRRIDLLANVAPIRDETGDIASVVAVFQEITELRELEKALQESLSETTALYEANRQISSATSVNDLASVLVNQLLSLMPNQVYVVLQEGMDRGPLQTRVAAAWPESYAGVTDVDLLALPRGLLMTEEPIIVSNIDQSIGFLDQALEFNLRLQAIQSGIQSFASIPLRARGRTLGWFTIVYFDKHSFMAEDRRFMTAVADQTALALDSIFLFQSTQDALRAVANLYRSSRRIAEARDLEEMIDTIRLELLNFNPDRIDVLLQRTQEDVSSFYFGLAWSKDPAFANTPSLPIAASTAIPIGDFDPMTREEYYIQAIDDEADATTNQIVQQLRAIQTPYQSVFSVPLSVGGRIVGRVSMGFRESHTFVPDEYQFITTLADAAGYLVENDLLFKQTQESLEETGVLYQASRAIANAENREEIIQAVIDYAADASVDKVLLLSLRSGEWSGEMAELEVATSWGRDQFIDLQGLRFNRHQLPFWDDIATTKLVWMNDVANDPSLSENARLGYKALGISSFVIVPLRTPNRLIGAILLASAETREHQDREIRIYQSLADLAAVQLENKRLFEQTELRARQLTTSAQVSRAATSILNLDELFPRVVDLIRESFQYDHVQIFMVDETGERALLRASTGEAGRTLLNLNHSLPVGSRSVIGQTTGQGIPVLVADTALSETHRPNPHLPDTRSEIAFPLIVKGRVVGALDVQSNQAGLFTEDDVQALTTMADQLAVAIDNAQLFEISQQRAAEMAFLFDITTFAAAMPSLSVMLETVSQVLAGRMNASSVVFFLNEVGRNRLSAQAMVIAVSDGDSQTLHSLEPTVKIPIGEGLAGQVAESRTHIVVQDFEGSAFTPMDISARSAIYLPLASGENLIGVMGVEGQRQGQFGEDALRLLQTLSTAISAVIQSTLLVEELQRTNERLREIDQLKTNFLAAMSHELRTPLNSIIGFSSVILKGIDGPINDMQKQDIQIIHSSGKHLLGLVNDILDQAKIEAGKMELSPDYFELAPVIKGVMSSAIGLTRDKPIRLHTEIEESINKAYGDEFRTRQILFNLLSNAAKFTEQGSITLSAFIEKGVEPPMITVAVRDTGIGIPPEYLDTIFEAFQQIDNSTTRSAEGTGLGLPLSRSLAELQGGNLWLESQEGVGSTFYVTIPLQPPAVPQPEESGEMSDTLEFGVDFNNLVDEIKAEHPVSRQKIILAIDDELGMINLYRRYLSKEGWQVIGLTNPEETEEMVANHNPMMILLDINMPNRDGWQVLEKLKDTDHTYRIPVIVCSINTDTQRSYRLGAVNHLVKPFVETDLIKAVRETEANLAS